ncbi:sensor histidine kinase [Rudanella lutea]|uniref:sensor histidine kinase n=1 Tax=Rudanella lutea TaxID=451374 RepID=UPI00037FBA07|nr:sensor histidine kinase [Rudanella lutea]
MKSIGNLFAAISPDRRIALAFLVALLLIAAGFVLSFYSYSRYGADSDRVQATHEAINGLEDVLSSLKDVENGTRGYLASGGDSLYLEAYIVARRELPDDWVRLRKALGDNPRQLARLDTLEAQARTKLAIDSLQIRSRTDRRALNSRLLIAKLKMDNIRRSVAWMIAEEKSLMKARNEKAAASYQQTIVVIFLLSMLTFLTLIAAYNSLNEELTRRQLTEDQLRGYEDELQARIRQLTTSNEELERFAFIASHDLQEPLRKIQSFAGLITQRARLDTETSLFMGKITGSADRMSRMIKDLLEFSRVSNQAHNYQTVGMSEIVGRVLDDMELQIKGLDVDIRVDPLPVLPVIPSQMEQVFANLISNAIKYRKPDTRPVVRVTWEPVDEVDCADLTSNRAYVKISVCDNGIGFDEKYAERIFQLFGRLHPQTAYDGTGIGLAVCKRIVMAHQGYIRAHSKPGEGATFDLILPEKLAMAETDDEGLLLTPSSRSVVPLPPESAPAGPLAPGSDPA